MNLGTFLRQRTKHRLNDLMSLGDHQSRVFWQTAKLVLGDDRAQLIAGVRGSERLSLIGERVLFSNDIEAFATEFRAGVSEVIHWPIYSFRAYDNVATLRLFDQNIGAATNGLSDTNMQAAGMMTGGEAHIAMSLRIVPVPAAADVAVTNTTPAVAFAEWYQVLHLASHLVFKIGDKTYLEHGPLSGFPSGFGPGTIHTASAVAASTQNVSFCNNGSPDNNALFRFDPPLLILPNRTFSLVLNWATAVNLTTAGRLGAWLDGYRIRSVQ